MAEFSLPQQRFPGPVEVPAPNVSNLTAGSAHTSVLPVVDPSWANMLPRGPNMGDMISAAELQAKLQQTQRQDKGRNMLAQLYGNPQNVGPDGALKPEAMRMLAAAGYPDQMLSVMGTQAEIAQRQQQTRAASSKFMSDEQTRLMTDFEPLVAEYDRNVKEVGQPRAREVFQQRYTEEVSKAKTSGLYSPATVARINPTGDPERLRANILGLKGVQDSQLAQSHEQRAIAGEGRAAIASARGSEDKPANYEYIDQAGNRRTGLLTYNQDSKTFYDSENRPVKQAIRSIGTQSVDLEPKYVGTVAGEDGKPKQVPLAFVSSNPPGQRYVDPQTSQPVDATNVHQARAQDSVDKEAARSTAEAIYEMRQAPLTSYAMRSGNGPEIMRQIEEIGKERGKPYNAQNWSRAKTLQDGYSRVTPQSAGGQMLSINTATQHLAQMQTLADALQNREVPALNRALNYVQTQLGHPEVTNYDTAAQIVADEVLKAVIGSGAVFDREKLLGQLSNSRSPEQIKGGIDTVKGLMGGRVSSLYKQWNSTGLSDDDFKTKLTDEAFEAVQKYVPSWKGESTRSESKSSPAAAELHPPIANPDAPAAQPGAGAPAPATAPASSEAPPIEMLKEGKETTFKTGGTWTLRDGKPVKVRD